MKVMMNGVDVTDISQNFTSEEWDKLKLVGGHTYVYQRREFLSGRGGRSNNRGGRTQTTTGTQDRNVAAATTDIVEYNANSSISTSTNTSQSSISDRGGRSGSQFGPRRNN
jgi:hypothetical protein